MTISTTTRTVTHNGNGVAVNFTYPFKITDQFDLRVYLKSGSVFVLKTLGTDYTVSGVGSPSGGTVSFTAAPAVGTGNVRFLRRTALTQLVDYITNDDFPAEIHEAALDKLTMAVQDYLGDSMTLDATADFWDAKSKVIKNVADPVDAQDAATLAYGEANWGGAASAEAESSAIAAAASAAEAESSAIAAAASAASLATKLAEFVTARDYGALCNGVFDDATAVNAAIAAMSAVGGGLVRLTPGAYRFDTTINMASNVTVLCDPGVTISAENLASGDVVAFTGTVGSEYTFAASAARGDTTISLSGSPAFADGNILHLVSYVSVFSATVENDGGYNLGYHATDNCYFSEWNIVADDLGSGTYRIATPFEFPGWTTSSKAKVVTPVQNAHWIGGTINRTTSGYSIFTSSWSYQCSVQDVVTNRGNQAGTSVAWTKSWKCEARNVTNNNDPTYLFNYLNDHSYLNRFKTVGTQDCGFVGLKESFGGQSVDFSYSSSGSPYSNVRSYCRDGHFQRCFEGLTSHQGCYQEQWIDNTITDCYDDGIVLRGYMPTVHGNIITSTVDVTDDLIFTAGTFVIGRLYSITTVGTTDFTLIGAASNTVGVNFVATGIGSGTGTATQTDTYGIKLIYGGARRADISNNVIRGFYGAFGITGSSTLGEWGNMISNIHDNEISHCFVGLLTNSTIGLNNSSRLLTYQNNRHSAIGRYVVSLGGYIATATIKGNVLEGAFRYTGTGGYVAFVRGESNCPALSISDNRWMRSKGTNAAYAKYFVIVDDIDDLTAFPKSDWACQSHIANNYALFDTDASFTYYTLTTGVGYAQANTVLPAVYFSAISSGVAEAILSPWRHAYLQVDTEGGAATDDLDQVNPYANCFFQEGDVLYIRDAANSRDVTIRDITTSGAGTNGFQTPGGASITLGSSNDVVTCVYSGTYWLVSAQSING